MTIEVYRQIIEKKRVAFEMRGMTKWGELPSSLFPHQVHGVEFALRAGCAALFYDTGLGKTAMALSWAHQVIRHTNKPVLMLAPLAVGPQHVREAARLGIDAQVIRDGSEVTTARVYVLNYDRLDKVDPTIFGGVILDESSILKSFTGITTRKLIAFSQGEARIIITKPSIAGFGLNWQHCARQAFIGLSFSYESYYQAVRRSWRFGQQRPVHVHIACADTERAIYETVTRKAEDHGAMKRAMEKAMRNASQARKANVHYNPTKEATLPAWMAA